MGKRARKTRWRTLPIGDEHSDSEESNSTLDMRTPPTYHQKYYSRFTYSTQSTPTRRYQSDSTKSTRSSSTASENKITFNEDEYTRITTPRQDVLFKKGYLNKPKAYSTQTSTGNSTTSTGNSTGNGTPDYQSTDLEYESQFVFPNGFLDQNGIYYVNSYEPYPLMVYNAQPYYNDSCGRTKKYSTESLAESASTTNDESSQETVNHNGVGQGEGAQHTTPPPQTNGHPHHPPQMPTPTEYGQVYNVVYPGFYYNGLCPPQELVNGQSHQSEPKRIKRRRRRKLSPSKVDGEQQNGTTSEYTEDEATSTEDEESSQKAPTVKPETETSPSLDHSNENPEPKAPLISADGPASDQNETESDNVAFDQVNVDNTGCDTEKLQNDTTEIHSECTDQSVITNTAENSLNESDVNDSDVKVKYDLKPDAQEFVPRALRPENIQYYKIPPNFVPVPLLSPMAAQNYNHPYLPQGIPLNFVHQNHHMYPGYVPGYVPTNFIPEQIPPPINGIQTEVHPSNQYTDTDISQEFRSKGDIDIRTVVSKLEEVAKEPLKSESTLEKIERNQLNMSPSKKLGPYRHFDERKKFFSKNQKQNGYHQKRPYNKYQSNGYNEVPSNDTTEFTETSHRGVREHPRIIEAVVNGVHEDQNEVSEEVGCNVDDVKHISVSEPQKLKEIEHQMGTSDSKGNTQQNIRIEKGIPTTIEETRNIHINQKRLLTSPHFPTRISRDTPKPKEYVNGPNDIRNKWQRRDENIQRREQKQPEEKLNQGYKPNESPNHTFNKRFTPNSPSRRLTSGPPTYSPSETQKRYSETVKKSSQPPKPVIKENTSKNIEIIKPAIPEVINTNTPISKTQWIAVSNKKKRRNRNIEEIEDSCESPEEIQQVKVEEINSNDFLQNMITNGHSKPADFEPNDSNSSKPDQIPEMIQKSPIKILEVRDLEKELLSSVGIEIKEEKETPNEEKIVDQQLKSKKKSKKGSQKQITKRVIITDIDLSESLPEAKIEEIIEEIHAEPEEVKVEIVEEDPKPEVRLKESEIIEPKLEANPVLEPEVVPIENIEKKSKKKKKKQAKTLEVSSPNTTVTNCEDTYDFLLENTFSNNSDDKTNMEVSQELDLIIQRGMYSSLEEKIKSLNIIPIKEEFFQSVVRSSREPSMEKSPEFSKLLANSMPKFKYCMASVEDATPKIPLNNLDQPSTSKNGLFVDNLEVNELLKDIYGKEGSPEIIEILKNASPPRDIVEINQEERFERKRECSINKENPDKEKLYPITQAVKNWMTKTRENTPEVEILKSPSVIFKEFCEQSTDEETGTESVNGKTNGTICESDEEITVYSASRNNSDTVDLLDCWENEISIGSGKNLIEDGCDNDLKKTADIKENEDAFEVYESKFGQNEDFLELQKEIEEKKKVESDARSRNFPKHGALPYRAICCNIM